MTIAAQPLVSVLRERVCIEVRGADAGAFLHGQLSRAVLPLDESRAPLAAWADSRGRVRALFRVVKQPQRWLLVTPRDGVDTVVEKLRRFVLRAKVELAPASDVAVGALLGDVASVLGQADIGGHLAQNRLVHRDGLDFVYVGGSYWQVVGAQRSFDTFATSLPAAPPEAAALAELELGIPEISPRIAERFVAQMLNLDELGALSFDKGCYPGQEIIARVHNLGGVKRRARRYRTDGPPPPTGAAVLAEGREEAGEVVRAAPAAHGAQLLAVVDHAGVGARLTCGGAPLTELPLPFAVPLD